jgi:hypothetical protein
MMSKEYKVNEVHGQNVISCEENGVLYSFIEDPTNPDYQAYLRWLNGEPEPEPIVHTPAPVEALFIQEVTVNE